MGDVVESVCFLPRVIINFPGTERDLSIGADAMIHLLTDTSIFVSLPNGCLCQMSGVPVVNLRPSVPVASAAEGPADKHGEKRPAEGGAASARPTKKLKTYDSVGSSRSGQGQKPDDGAV